MQVIFAKYEYQCHRTRFARFPSVKSRNEVNLPQFSDGAGSDEDGKAKTTLNSFRSERYVTAETGPFPDIIRSICTKKSSCVSISPTKKEVARESSYIQQAGRSVTYFIPDPLSANFFSKSDPYFLA